MKKFLSIILSLILLMCMSATVFATDEGTQTVSVNVPVLKYDYKVTIPASCTIEYGNTEPQSIGSVRVESDYWDNITNKYTAVLVNVSHNNFLSNDNGDKITAVIGYKDYSNVFISENGESGWQIAFQEDGNGLAGRGKLYMVVPDWSEAESSGSYKVIVTYTSEMLEQN